MKKSFFLLFLLATTQYVLAQKKPLDHSVYDSWQAIGSQVVSNNGTYVAYTINVQEGDGVLVLKKADSTLTRTFKRGYAPLFSNNNNLLIFKIKPLFKDIREAKIKKRKPEDMPKDSMGIYNIATGSLQKMPRIKSVKVPEENGDFIAYHAEKLLLEPKPKQPQDSAATLQNLAKMADSLLRVADSLKNKIEEAKQKGVAVLKAKAAAAKPLPPKAAEEAAEEGTDLTVVNTETQKAYKYKLVADYYFTEQGNKLLIETTKKSNDTLSKAYIVLVDLLTQKADTILTGFNDAKNFAITPNGDKIAFVAERDSAAKALQKFHKLWYYSNGMDSATLIAAKGFKGIDKLLTISPDYANAFSNDGKKIYFGLTTIKQPKDTSLPEFEAAKLDVWHYNDDALQPQQLVQLQQDLKKSFVTVFNTASQQITPLANDSCEVVLINKFTKNNELLLGLTTKGYRIQNQWEGTAYKNIFLVNTSTGEQKLVAKKVRGNAYLSPNQKYVVWYNWTDKQYYSYDIALAKTSVNTKLIKYSLSDEDDDQPDEPSPHGFISFSENDAVYYVYDKYDIWQINAANQQPPVCVTNEFGRKNKIILRSVDIDKEKNYIATTDTLLLHAFDEVNKGSGYITCALQDKFVGSTSIIKPQSISNTAIKAKYANTLMFTIATPQQSANVHTSYLNNVQNSLPLSNINKQQSKYNWLTLELHKWKMFDGKMSEGLLYKPEDFDSTKKYPVIFYFYERNSDTRYTYKTPAPSASTINIPYFVSNGYLVFDPNIYYKKGEPGQSAYNSVVSAARYLSKFKFVDSTKMAIQGQSWGGYQVAYLITRTNMFAAAGSGAPVSNMFSAYGGIRWGTGISRQFQYEHTQSRIGATPWQRPDLYTKNSPVFFADKVKTPLLIMHNDKDGAVPWYQGIEYFTALKRLGKKVWLLQYNDEDHNLMERRNRKDLSVRLQQFFDMHLKNKPAAKWLSTGVPATEKGIDWGLKIEE